MMLLEFQFLNTTDDERQIIPDFCDWLCMVLYAEINTKINRKKISLRINYILEKVDWINWNSDKYSISVTDIMERIANSITYEQHKDNLWKIMIDTNMLIPYSATSIDRLIRFINYGDNKQRGTGMFTKLEQIYNHNKLKIMWNMFCVKHLGKMTDAKIIAR